MKKLLLIISLLFIGQIAIGQSLHRIYPIEDVDATDTLLYLVKSFENGDTCYSTKDTLSTLEASDRLSGWLGEAENNETKWRLLYLRDSLFADSIQALITKYFP